MLWEKSKLKEIAVFYSLSEMMSWLMSIFLLILEDLKSFPRSWMLYIFWSLSILSGVLKLITRSVFSYIDEYYSWELCLQLFHGIIFLVLLYFILPPMTMFKRHKEKLDDAIEPPKISRIPMFLVTLTMVNGQIVYGLAVLILPNYATELKATPLAIGCIFSSYAAAILCTSSFFATLSERYGRVRVMIAGSFALAASTLLFALADTVWMLIGSRLLQGIAASANFTPGLSLVTDLAQGNALGEVLGSVTGWSGIGLLIGPPLGGFLF